MCKKVQWLNDQVEGLSEQLRRAEKGLATKKVHDLCTGPANGLVNLRKGTSGRGGSNACKSEPIGPASVEI
jgi:hypothetical protein